MRVKYLKKADEKRLNISQFPNFSASGSVKGMKEKYYGRFALLVRCGSYIYCVGDLRRNNGILTRYGKNIYFNYAY